MFCYQFSIRKKGEAIKNKKSSGLKLQYNLYVCSNKIL